MLIVLARNVDWWDAIYSTLAMTLTSTLLAYLVGLPLGVILKCTSKSGLFPNRVINGILGVIVNFLRSIPCLILLVILIPVTRAVFGRASGEWYTMVIPLFFSTFAYVARIVEQSLQDVDPGEVEAIKSMGASNLAIITKVYIPEARSSLIIGVAVTLVNVIGYTSFAWNVAAGGLISEIYEFYKTNTGSFTSSWVFWLLLAIVVVLVEIIQELGLLLAKKLDKRKKVK